MAAAAIFYALWHVRMAIPTRGFAATVAKLCGGGGGGGLKGSEAAAAGRVASKFNAPTPRRTAPEPHDRARRRRD